MVAIACRLFAAACLALPLLAGAATLRVVTADNYPPYVYRAPGGTIEGYAVDIWRLWEQKTGIKVALTATSWAEAQRRILAGQADVIDLMFRTPAREPLYDFSPPFAVVTAAIYADASISGIHDVGSLRGFEVGAQAGDACVERLVGAGIPGVRTYPDNAALMGAVSSRTIKIFCLDDYPAAYYLYRLGMQRNFVKAFDLYQDAFHRAVRKGDAATLATVNRGMALITEQEKAALHQKWMGRPVVLTAYAQRVMLALAVLALVILALLAWLAALRKAVRNRTAEIREQAGLLGEMSALACIGAWEVDLASSQVQWTDELARIYEAAQDAARSMAYSLSFFPGENRTLLERTFGAAIASGQPRAVELEMVTGAGNRKWVSAICRPVMVGGKAAKVRGTLQDITARRKLEESMQTANLIYQTSSVAIALTDEANTIIDANPAYLRQAGCGLDQLIGSTPGMFGSDLHEAGFYRHLWQEVAASGQWQGELRDRSADGAVVARFVDVRVIRHPDGHVYRHVLQFHDITEQKRKDELIWKQTNFDALTGLPNRRLFVDRLEQEIKKAHGTEAGLGLMFIDLDRFKAVNDAFGREQGDRALRETTRRLVRSLPATATLGRLEGDKFAVIVSGPDRHLQLETAATAAIAAVSAPLAVGHDQVAYVSAGVGIAVYPDDGARAEELLKNAEHALVRAKKAGRGRFGFFTPALQREAHARLMLTNDLRQALARDELQVHYQPIVEVASGRIRKAEALLRWNHPIYGMISPARFIPLAEESGLILDIGDWVVQQAIASSARWQRKFGSVIELSVNNSPVQFEQAGACQWIDRILGSGLPPHSLAVEITEGVLVKDSDQVRDCLRRLRQIGAKVSIDDFGTGFSALSYLKHFDIDYLKIDKSFIDALIEDESDQALTEAIVNMAHKLGIETIAEGVETAAQRDLLAAFGCDYIQGYLYSRPVPAEQFEEMLEPQAAQ